VSSRRSIPSIPRAWLAAAVHDPLPIGGVAAALTLGTYALLRIPVSVPLLIATSCGATLVYGADRALVPAPEDTWNRPDRVSWIRGHRYWLAVEGTLLFVVGAAAAVCLRPSTLLLGGLLAGAAVLHLWPTEGSTRWSPMRLSKPLLLAGVWVIATVGLPLLEAETAASASVGMLGAYRWLFVLPNLLLLDWGDRHGDRIAGRHVWGLAWGETGIRVTATAILVVALAAAGTGMAGGLPVPLMLVDTVGVGLMMGAVWNLDPGRSSHRLVFDLLVSWPALTAVAAWGMG